MLFNSLDFLLFLAVVLPGQHFLTGRARNLFLLAASYFFYGCWDWRFLFLVALSTLIDYVCGRAIAASSDPRRRRWILVASCTASLTILGFFKYAGFFAASTRDLLAALNVPVDPWVLGIVLPVGVSFYTFQTMSYTIDVYRGAVPAVRRLDDFALYVAFFPQLVAGPIERGAHLVPQILRPRRATWADVQAGTWLCMKGIFKKAVIADNLAPIVNSIFALPEPSAAQVLCGAYAFAFQIYGDFAGYTDIARGVARIMGYDLAMNFRLPYLAVSPSAFWQRWHISLSTWLRDYLYIPLGGNRGGPWKTCRNLFVTMLLGGLWHGAAWNFVLWGGYHGLLLVIFRWADRGAAVQPASASPRTFLGWGLRVVFMFHLTCIGWVLFRAHSLGQIAGMFGGLARWAPLSADQWQQWWVLTVLCLPLMLVQLIEEWSGDLNLLPRLSLVPRSAVYAAVAVGIACLGNFGGQEFIYFQF
jgi:alginate O-acetyltransferase complex protein AlgI